MFWKGTSQCALQMGLSNVPREWDYQMCPGKELAHVPREWDYPMCHVNGTSQCALGMGLVNVPWE